MIPACPRGAAPSGRRWKADGMATTILCAPSQSSRVAQSSLMSAIRCVRRREPRRVAKEAVGGMSGMVIADRPPGDVGSACCHRITSVQCSCSAASPIQSSLVSSSVITIIAVAFEFEVRSRRECRRDGAAGYRAQGGGQDRGACFSSKGQAQREVCKAARDAHSLATLGPLRPAR